MDMAASFVSRTEAEWAGAFEAGKGWALVSAGADQVERVAALSDTPLAPPDGYLALTAAVTGNATPLPALIAETIEELL